MDPVDKSNPAYERLTTSSEKQTSKNGAKVFWSRGNGWAIGGLVRILTHLPEDHQVTSDTKNQYVKMAVALKACQQADGFWRTNSGRSSGIYYEGKQWDGLYDLWNFMGYQQRHSP